MGFARKSDDFRLICFTKTMVKIGKKSDLDGQKKASPILKNGKAHKFIRNEA